ncbi:hypothetical protein RJ641_010544 [Dillenia turbinata]|uniref:Uncharacterized protein n=1 Tax=Dillenia turbinata TaxID=194707 RepID=A0AAN8Z2S4_9MAGN
MITRAKLAEQLRDYQIRSQRKCPALFLFSPNPQITSWVDVGVAIFWAFLFGVLVLLSYLALYSRHFYLSLVMMGIAIFLPIHLKISRQTGARKRDRKFSLPLSM